MLRLKIYILKTINKFVFSQEMDKSALDKLDQITTYFKLKDVFIEVVNNFSK